MTTKGKKRQQDRRIARKRLNRDLDPPKDRRSHRRLRDIVWNGP